MSGRALPQACGRDLSLALTLFALTSCGSGGGGGSGATAGLEPGHLIMAWDASREPASLDGHIEPYQPAWLIDSLIADPLVVLGPDGEYRPGLATEWSSSTSADAWTFKLRDGVFFQDGTPFDAEAVKFNIERILDPRTQSAEMAAQVGPVARIEVVDSHTVTLHYERPWVTVLDAFRRVPIWSPTEAAKWPVDDFSRHLVGAGPFTLAEWVPNSHVTLERWADYGGWTAMSDQPGPVKLARVTIRFIGEEAVLGNLVKTGDAHITMNLPAAYVEDYQDSDQYTLLKGFQAGTGLSMVMNVRVPPLRSLAVRRSLLYGTDQDALNDLLYDGNFLVTKSPLNTVHPCYRGTDAERYPLDRDRARALLEEAGYVDRDGDGVREAYGVADVEDGTPLRLRWTILHREEIGEAIQSQWRELGVELVLEKVPGPVQLERVNARDFDLMYERQRSPDPMLLDMLFNSANDVVGGWAWSGYVDEELDGIVRQLRVVPDTEARCELARRAQDIVLDQAIFLPTLSEPIFYAVSNRVKGFELSSEGQFFFLHNTSLLD